MRLILTTLAIVILATFYSCSSEQGTTIKGVIEGAENLTAYLDKKSLDNTQSSLGSTSVDASGNFKLNFPEGVDPGIYRMRIGSKGFDLILNGTEKTIDVGGKLQDFQNFQYTLTGSELSQTYQTKIQGIMNRTLDRNALGTFIQSEADPLLAAALSFATTPANPASHGMYKQFGDKILASYPGADFGNQLLGFSQTLEKQHQASQSKYTVKVGDVAPEISLPDVNGKIRKLSDLKGKLVLLDFWASWCGPCRRANPHVVEMYDKYNKEGFEVFNVSLDGLDTRTRSRIPEDQVAVHMEKSKKRWLDAIKKDNLKWNNHVSDLKKWESDAAGKYGVRSIPTTFLIGRDGSIAALNPRNNLEAQIKKHI